MSLGSTLLNWLVLTVLIDKSKGKDKKIPKSNDNKYKGKGKEILKSNNKKGKYKSKEITMSNDNKGKGKGKKRLKNSNNKRNDKKNKCIKELSTGKTIIIIIVNLKLIGNKISLIVIVVKNINKPYILGR
jgi:hypothetical protein